MIGAFLAAVMDLFALRPQLGMAEQFANTPSAAHASYLPYYGFLPVYLPYY